MSVVVGLDDPRYCETKAIELITEAQFTVGEQYEEKIAQAISLLALARIQRGAVPG